MGAISPHLLTALIAHLFPSSFSLLSKSIGLLRFMAPYESMPTRDCIKHILPSSLPLLMSNYLGCWKSQPLSCRSDAQNRGYSANATARQRLFFANTKDMKGIQFDIDTFITRHIDYEYYTRPLRQEN